MMLNYVIVRMSGYDVPTVIGTFATEDDAYAWLFQQYIDAGICATEDDAHDVYMSTPADAVVTVVPVA